MSEPAKLTAEPISSDPSPKFMDLKEFMDIGLLQEVNRQILHPCGLAMAVSGPDDGGDGPVEFLGIFDYRDDPEGVIFADPPGTPVDPDKAARVKALMHSKADTRIELLGTVVQKVPGGSDART